MQHTSVHNSSGISFSRGVGLDGVEGESGVCALERSRVSTAGRYEHSLRLDILNRRLGNGGVQLGVSPGRQGLYYTREVDATRESRGQVAGARADRIGDSG